jgi:pre-mRNA-processing factor 19
MSHYLVCSISGKPASEPVVSTKTGKLYERSTLAKHIDMYGTDPLTNEPMNQDDFIMVNGRVFFTI